MKRIDHPGDWGSHWAELDGKRINDGDLLIVKWPDGFLEQISVTVEKVYGTVSDHGHEYGTTSGIAKYVTQHRGVKVAVPLDGLEAQWI